MILIRLFFFLTLFSHHLFSQADFVGYNQRYNPAISRFNPSFTPQADFYLSLPVISNFKAGFSSSSLSYRDVFSKKANDSIYIDLNSILLKQLNDNYIMANLSTDVIGLGFRIRRHFFQLFIAEHINLSWNYPKAFLELLIDGNGNKLGQEINWGRTNFDLSHYREVGLGYLNNLSCKWRVGGNLKLLLGQENVSIRNSSATLYTDPLTFDLTGQLNFRANTSGLSNFSRYNSLIVQPLSGLEFTNPGLGADLGVTYHPTPLIELSASALNLGFIRWKNQTHTYSSTGSQYTFSGLDVFTSNTNGNESNYSQLILDSLSKAFNIATTHSPYTTYLPISFIANAGLKLWGHNLNATALLRQIGNDWLPGYSLGYNLEASDFIEFNLNYSYFNNQHQMIGGGLLFNLGFTQLFARTDNITSFFDAKTQKNFNLSAGLVLVFGYLSDRPDYCDTDKDGVPNTKDQCPDQYGPKELNGCPDTDKDGVMDKLDRCPGIAGKAELFGCPDKDGDRIADYLDLCPDEPGSLAMNGCPDKDGDGVMDKQDECPTEPGAVKFKGCPDRDNDGIPDKNDD